MNLLFIYLINLVVVYTCTFTLVELKAWKFEITSLFPSLDLEQYAIGQCLVFDFDHLRGDHYLSKIIYAYSLVLLCIRDKWVWLSLK